MHTRSNLRPTRVAIRLTDGKPGFGIRWKLSVPRPSASTPAAGPVTLIGPSLTEAQRTAVEGIAARADRDGLLKIHERREGAGDQRERKLADVAAEELLNRSDSHRDSLDPAVNRPLEADPNSPTTR